MGKPIRIRCEISQAEKEKRLLEIIEEHKRKTNGSLNDSLNKLHDNISKAAKESKELNAELKQKNQQKKIDEINANTEMTLMEKLKEITKVRMGRA